MKSCMVTKFNISLVLVSLAVPPLLLAQQGVSPSIAEKALQVAEAQGNTQVCVSMLQMILKRRQQSHPQVSTRVWDELARGPLVEASRHATNLIAQNYAIQFTEQEMDGIIAFFQTSPGKDMKGLILRMIPSLMESAISLAPSNPQKELEDRMERAFQSMIEEWPQEDQNLFVNFLESPTGRKMSELAPVMQQRSLAIGKEVTERFKQRIAERLRQEGVQER